MLATKQFVWRGALWRRPLNSSGIHDLGPAEGFYPCARAKKVGVWLLRVAPRRHRILRMSRLLHTSSSIQVADTAGLRPLTGQVL